MHTDSSILIAAPINKVFDATSDLSAWPSLLPHYRWIRWIEGGPDHGIVEMAAMRGCIPIKWISEYRRDHGTPSLWFRHISPFTKGMEVRWIYDQQPDGVLITITHELKFRWPLLAPLADPIIRDFMIGWVAPQTLSSFKRLLEERP